MPPKGWGETGESLFAVMWEETVFVEEEGVEEDDEETETFVDMWLFRSQAEAMMFVAEEIWERIELNKDNLPPKTVRGLQEALQGGRILPLPEPDGESAVELWIDASESYFDLPPEEITIRIVPLMARR